MSARNKLENKQTRREQREVKRNRQKKEALNKRIQRMMEGDEEADEG